MNAHATIENWSYSQLSNERYWIVGNVYGDTKGRFEDGDFIHTSEVILTEKEVFALKRGDVVKTRNSFYKLGRKEGEPMEEENVENVESTEPEVVFSDEEIADMSASIVDGIKKQIMVLVMSGVPIKVIENSIVPAYKKAYDNAYVEALDEIKQLIKDAENNSDVSALM